MVARLLADERGGLMPFTAVMALLMLAAAGLAVDWGRYLLAREAVVTATEAGAMAGSGEAVRKAEFTAQWQTGHWENRYRPRTCFDEQSKPYECGEWVQVCVKDPPPDPTHTFRHGRESELLDDPNAPTYWANQLSGGCLSSPEKRIVSDIRRWAEFPPGSRAAAETAFAANFDGLRRAGGRATGVKVAVYDREGDPGYPSVLVRARAEVPAVLARVLGIGSFRLERCAQAEVRGYSQTQDMCRQRGG